MVERIAQQMFERPDQLFQHRAIELGLSVVDLQVRALVELLRRRAQNPIQSFGQADERNRANREQPLLHVARQARLRQQRGVGVVQILEQRLLHGGHVVHAFRERTRELLEPRKAIELQRIELLIDRLDRRHPRLDLRFRLQLDFPHLSPQAYHAVRELEQIRFERAQFAFDTGARDRDFARLIDQAIDDVSAHAQHRAGSRFHIGGLGRCGCQRDNRRRRRRERNHVWFGAYRRRDGIRRNVSRPTVEFRQRHIGAAFAQRVQHKPDMVEIGVERFEQIGCRFA